jgi:hypothetical protein
MVKYLTLQEAHIAQTADINDPENQIRSEDSHMWAAL